jgi:predicted O-linked N-acetylglucosamine transferase (SPINDLY family)
MGPPREHVLQKLGVAPDRVQFVFIQRRQKYMETFNRIDLCLDTIPYNGHTTSLDGLWMGVPMVTRVGQTIVGRAGLSQLHNLDLLELVAHTDEQFVKLAVDWAGNLDRLGRLRATLRQRMERSPLMDGPRFARHIEAAYRQMWQAWCAAPKNPTRI